MYSLTFPSMSTNTTLYQAPIRTQALNVTYTQPREQSNNQTYRTIYDLLEQELTTTKDANPHTDVVPMNDDARKDLTFSNDTNVETQEGIGSEPSTSSDPVARLRASIPKELLNKYNISLE